MFLLTHYACYIFWNIRTCYNFLNLSKIFPFLNFNKIIITLCRCKNLLVWIFTCHWWTLLWGRRKRVCSGAMVAWRCRNEKRGKSVYHVAIRFWCENVHRAKNGRVTDLHFGKQSLVSVPSRVCGRNWSWPKFSGNIYGTRPTRLNQVHSTLGMEMETGIILLTFQYKHCDSYWN